MAVLDIRLTPLIETLTAVGADWLAFELIDGIRRGREIEETPDALGGARQRVRQAGATEPAPSVSTSEPQPILGDDQIEWATVYVFKRLEATLAELAASIDNLDAIVDGQATKASITMGDSVTPLVVFPEREDQQKIDRAAADQARAALPKLRAALEEWSKQVRGAP